MLWQPVHNGDWQRADSGSTIGGAFQVRVVVQPNSGYLYGNTATVVSSSVTELADHHFGPRSLGSFVLSQPNESYGDPTSNVAVLQSDYLHIPHNATYRLRVTVFYRVFPPPQSQPVQETAEMDITLSNLRVVDSRPEAWFAWAPETMTSVPFSVSLQHAQQGDCTVNLEIYRSDNNTTPVFTAQFPRSGEPPVNRPGVWQWSWDGRLADGSLAERGVYLCRVVVFAWCGPGPDPAFLDQDSNISSFLQVLPKPEAGQPIRNAKYRGAFDSQAEFDVWYRLASLNDRPASEGKVVVFDPTLAQIHEKPLTGDDLNVGDHLAVVRVPEDSVSRIGRYLFLVCAKDNHIEQDRAHRRLWALPLGLTCGYQQVTLTEPRLEQDEQGSLVPMLFRGRPRSCPVLIRGEVLPSSAVARPIIGMTVEKGYVDAQGEWQVVEPEQQVQGSELEDWRYAYSQQAGGWGFQVVWNQQLDRTQSYPHRERYRLRAYALCEGTPSGQHADFRVMSMARPVSAQIVSDYTDDPRQGRNFQLPPIEIWSDASGRRAVLSVLLDPSPHLGIDYGAGVGTRVNSAEVGKVREGQFLLPEKWQIVDNNVQDMVAYLAQRYGFVQVQADLRGRLPHPDTKFTYLGPHRVVEHGKVNLSLVNRDAETPDGQYERDEVSTAYAHCEMAPEGMPSNGADVNISDPITWVKGYYIPDPEYPQSRQLSLGYLMYQDVDLSVMYRVNGIPVTVDAHTQILRIPSTTGPHLHFEVRRNSMEGQVIKGVPHQWGEVNPHHYLGVKFGETR